MASKKKMLTSEEIRENSVPEGVEIGIDQGAEGGDKTGFVNTKEETPEPQEPKKERPPKDYVQKALELVQKQREGDGSQELFVVEQSLVEALRFIEKHEKKGGA